MKIKQKLTNYFEKKTRKKLLKKEMDKLKMMEKSNPKKKTDKPNIEKKFNDSLITTKKMLDYCKQKGYTTKEDWDKAGIPMKDVVKDLLVSARDYSDVRVNDVREIRNG